MEGPVDYRIVDGILRGHVRRLEEASLICDHVVNYPARRPPHVPAQGATSTTKRAPPLSTTDAVRGGMYTAALEVVRKAGVIHASQLTGIPISTIRDVAKRVEETGTVTPKKRGGKEGTRTKFTTESIERLQDFIDEHPESTLKQMKEFLESSFDISPDTSTISKLLSNLKITNKTIVRVPVNRNTPLLAQKRREWALTWRYLERGWAKFVYIDEAGFNLHLTKGTGWAIVGFTPEVQVPRDKQKNVSLLAALIPGQKIESYVIKDGPITSETVVKWMESSLFPLCRRVFPLQTVVIVMDNAGCHGSLVEGCIVRNGFRYLKTIPYSPQTNPIERVFSQIKAFVARRSHADGSELKSQIKQGIESVTEENTTNYLRAHLSVMEQIQRGFLLGSDHVFNCVDE